MKIGIVVEGVSEYASLQAIYAQLKQRTGNQFFQPVKAAIQPDAPIGVIVRQCIKRVQQVIDRGASLVLVLIDRETNSLCAGELATDLEKGFQRAGINAVVVIKDRTFENWLVADTRALKQSPGRFEVSRATARAVEPNKADQVDALRLLKRSVRKGSYHKVEDSKRILGKADVLRIALHSRSFRRFLRVAGDSAYAAQSASP